jgi:hypothetical protein
MVIKGMAFGRDNFVFLERSTNCLTTYFPALVYASNILTIGWALSYYRILYEEKKKTD